MLDDLVRHLRACCLQVVGEHPGCGFFVGPKILVTCSHVLGRAAAGEGVKLRRWTETGPQIIESAQVLGTFPQDDLAILETPFESETFVPLDNTNQIHDELVAVGFPKRRDGREEFDQFTATYEGQTQFVDPSGHLGVEEKFKAGQVEPGFSGGPVLNLRSRRVTAVVVATRDRSSDLGGWAIEAGLVRQRLDDLGIKLPDTSRTWQRAEQLADNAEAPNLKERARNPFFTGREGVLKQLEKELVAWGRVALSGLGGIGKTQTAVEYAHRHFDQYQYAFWANAASREALVDSYVKIATLLGLPNGTRQDHADVIVAVRNKLSATESWFLLLDNVDDPGLAREFMPPTKGHVLLTTRASAVGGVARLVEIEHMESEEGATFLLRRTGYVGADATLDATAQEDRAAAKEIVAELGGLPLALDQAAAYIEQARCGLSEYLTLYRTHASELLRRRWGQKDGVKAGGARFDHPDPVATTWSVSFESVRRANPGAAELLRCCAVLEPPDSIPEEIFTEGAGQLGPELGTIASDPLGWHDALSEVSKFSLVRRDPKTRTLSIHRLVQAVLRDSMNAETRDLWHVRVVDALGYRVHPETISTGGKYGIIYCSNPGIVRGELSRMRNYLVSLEPYRIIGALTGQALQSRRYVGADWSEDDAAALVWFGGRFGPTSLELIEVTDGMLTRQIDLVTKMTAVLEPDFRRCDSGRYNQHLPFIIVSEGGEWDFDDAGHVRIDCVATTNPKRIPDKKSWAGRLEALWDIKEGDFVEAKISRIMCGCYPADPSPGYAITATAESSG